MDLDLDGPETKLCDLASEQFNLIPTNKLRTGGATSLLQH
jgi:hypothetical protein